MSRRHVIFALGIALLLLFPLGGQEEQKREDNKEEAAENEELKGGESEEFDFALQIELGAQSFNEDNGEQITYQSLGIYPEFIFGKIGIGLGLDLNYRFVDDEGNGSFEVREEDWVPDDERSFLDLYLPIFRYVRYGEKGDPIYGKIGSIEDGTLGNGFIMGGYSNSIFLPERRFVGLALDIDGRYFDFPYVGMETFAGNLARFDVIGTRLYARPLVNSDLGLLKELQIGTSFAADTEPDAIYDFVEAPDTDTTYSPDAVTMYSLDLFQPIIAKPRFSGAFYGDIALQPGDGNTHSGGLIGFGGKMLEFINYSINTLLLGDNFVPFYFDATYDLYRQEKYDIYSARRSVDGYAAWLASLGFGFFEDALVFNTSVDAAFVPQSGKKSTYPHLRSTFSVGEGLLPGIYFDLTYDKKYIEELSDFAEAENSLIGANIYYKAGIAVIGIGYTLRYIPVEEDWETTAKLSTTISI